VFDAKFAVSDVSIDPKEEALLVLMSIINRLRDCHDGLNTKRMGEAILESSTESSTRENRECHWPILCHRSTRNLPMTYLSRRVIFNSLHLFA
jgi:hypothetical protein